MAANESAIEVELQLGPDDDGRLTSAVEFDDAFYSEPWGYERVNGRLVVMSPDGLAHVLRSEPRRDRLGAYKLDRPDVIQAVVSQAWVRIDEDNDRIGDIGVYLHGKADPFALPDQVPDLMFEFVSRTKRDRQRDYVEKRAEYQKIGVRECVIVDRFAREVTVLTLGENGYDERVLTTDDIYTSGLLPGFSVRLSEGLPR